MERELDSITEGMPIKEKKHNLQFPIFDDDYSSGDDGSVVEKELAAARKEDQDVAVFMAIAKRLSMESLLHLLQGQARAALGGMGIENNNNNSRRNTTNKSTTKRPVKKRFRFAKDRQTRGGVLCEVFEIESVKDMTHLWWTDEESDEMRSRAVRTVHHVSKRVQDFTDSVETIVRAPLAKSKKQQYHVENAMKYLIENSHPRGLEFHIVPLMDQIRSAAISAVLEEQAKVMEIPYDESCMKISAVAMAFSLLNRSFAERMGSCDRVAALNAMIASW